jgi:hypothetical protein
VEPLIISILGAREPTLTTETLLQVVIMEEVEVVVETTDRLVVERLI